MKFEDVRAEVVYSEFDSSPDAYLVIGDKRSPVIRVGSKGDPSMQEMADALNQWAGK